MKGDYYEELNVPTKINGARELKKSNKKNGGSSSNSNSGSSNSGSSLNFYFENVSGLGGSGMDSEDYWSHTRMHTGSVISLVGSMIENELTLARPMAYIVIPNN